MFQISLDLQLLKEEMVKPALVPLKKRMEQNYHKREAAKEIFDTVRGRESI